MRILNVTQSYAPFFEFGGPPVKVRALAEGMAKRDHQVTVLTADWGIEKRLAAPPGPFGRTQVVRGVTAVYLPTWFHFRAVSWNPALGRYLRARLADFDVAHIYGLYDFFGPRVATECRRQGIPYVVEPIGMFVPIVRNIRMKRLYHRVWGRDMLQNAGAIIATAEQERDELVAGGIDPAKVHLRRNGVEVPATLPPRGAFREQLRIPAHAKLVLFLGRLSLKKSPDLLLKAFQRLQQSPNSDAVDVHLAFAGPDEAGVKTKLMESARVGGDAERVHFAGPLTGTLKWQAYRDADVFVLPSQNENFGNTAAESIAADTPVIVTDRCGIAPFVKDVAGLVVRHNEEELAGALSRLLSDDQLHRQLSDGCGRVASALSWEEPLREMEMIYSLLASGRET
ncbi:MAG TPA: glycosyltransferase [Candidatus Saccharimonadales bacterium]|nr:glycosyltransferase [Candidatus Saccharimonadales bacterium]